MPRKRRGVNVNAASDPVESPRAFTRAQAQRLWDEVWKPLQDSRDRMAECEDVALGRIQLEPPKHLIRSQGEQIRYLIPTSPLRKKLILNLTNDLMESWPIIERRRPPKGGPTTEARAEETETALNALLLDLFPRRECAGRSIQHGEYAVCTLLAEDAWDARPEVDDVLTSEEWSKLPKSEQKTYRKADMGDGTSEYKRTKVVYWRDSDGKGIEDEEYGRRDARQTAKAYKDALDDHCAQHPPFVIRGYSAFDFAHQSDGAGNIVAFVVRQLMEPSDILTRGYRCKGLELGEDGKPRVMIPRGWDATIWGKGGKIYLYQFYLWIDGDPCIAFMVGGQETDRVAENGDRVEAVTNLREKWGFTRLPVGVYYGQYLQTDNPDDRPVPGIEPVKDFIVAYEGLIGSANITAWRRGTSKYTVTPQPHIPPAAYIDSNNNLKPIDVDPDKDIVTTFGPTGMLAPLETSGDYKWLTTEFQAGVQAAMPAAAAFGGEGADSGREAALLHTYAQMANSMPREGIRRACEDSASFLLEWACCYMRTKKLTEIPMYANVETDASEGKDSEGPQTVMVRLKEAWIGRNYKATARYLPTPNPILIEQEVSLAEKGFGSFEDVQTARGKTNPQRERIKAINDKYWMSDRGQMELAAMDARKRGDIERAKAYDAWLAGQATPLAVGPDGQPIEMGPSAALDPSFTTEPSVDSGGSGPTSAQMARAGTIGAGRAAESGDMALTMGSPNGTGVAPQSAGVGGGY